MPKFKIFYSWQSDLSGSKTRYFIRDCIDDAIAFADESEAIEAVRDEATKDTTGSPNIVTTLFSKIDECDLFVADVTLCFTGDIEKDGTKKHSPNPNVLLELGYAVKTLGWERVICLCNTDYGTDYPFDIAHNRRTSFSLEGKDKKTVRRDVAKIIFSNIKSLQEQMPRAKEGVAVHILGNYDFEQKLVISALVPIEIGTNESYALHNETLLNEARQLLSDIQEISRRMRSANASAEAQIEIAEAVPPVNNVTVDKLLEQKVAVHMLAESYKLSEVPVVWKDIEEEKQRIQRWLDIEVDDSFFDLGGLKKVTQILKISSPALNGTDDEKLKYEKMQELSYRLLLLEVRTGYLKTFEGMHFIPIAIQNISATKDEDISIVITVVTGEIIEPDAQLIIEDYDGIQGLLCSDDDDPGIIPELFLFPEDGIIHTEEEPWNPGQFKPSIPVFNGTGFSMPDKTNEDYRDELSEYIASTDGKGYYEFDVQSLRPSECRWLSKGLLVKPIDGEIRISYRIHSANSDGSLGGTLEIMKGSTI